MLEADPDPRRAGTDAPPPFLEADPPPWAARALAMLLLVAAAGGLLASILIHVPETVSAPFVLVPVRGTDPVRSSRNGTVADVRAAEGQPLGKGEVVLVIRSGAVGEQSGELKGLEARVDGLRERLTNERQRHESQRSADDQEARRLDDRLAHLGQKIEQNRGLRAIQQGRYQARRDGLRADIESIRSEIGFKQGHLALARELAERHRKGYEQGHLSWTEYVRPQIEAERVAVDLTQLERQLEAAQLKVTQLDAERANEEVEWSLGMRALEAEVREVRSVLDKLRHETGGRLSAYRELDRGLREEIDRSRIRMATLRQGLTQTQGNEVSVSAPCAGTVLRLAVKAPGAVVREGDVLWEMACGEREGALQAELRVPPDGVSRLQPGQGVKLRYDAFPYQRHGVKHGTVRWISPAAVAVQGSPVFHAFVELADMTVLADGQSRPLMAGMAGRADVVVSRRAILTYAFEPLRRVKENLAGAPGR